MLDGYLTHELQFPDTQEPKDMHIPVEVWTLIENYLQPNPLDYIRLSHVCTTARSAFSSDRAWARLNPYGVDHPFQHFLDTLKSLTSMQKDQLYDSWKKPTKHIVWALNTSRLAQITSDENLYYKLGIIYSTSSLLESELTFHRVSDKHLLLCAVSLNPKAIYRANTNLLRDKQLILEAVKQDGKLLSLIPHDITDIREVVLAAVQNHGLAITLAPQEFWEDREVLLTALASSQELVKVLQTIMSPDSERYKKLVLYSIGKTAGEFFELPNLPLQLLLDPDIVLAVFHKYSHSLPHFKPIEATLRITPGLAEEAVKIHGSAFAMIPSSQRSDRNLLQTAVKTCGYILYAADPSLCQDRDIALEAVSQDGSAYMFIHQDLHNDREIVLEAVRTDTHALELTSNSEFRDDFEIVYRSVLTDPKSITHASLRLKDCSLIISRAISLDGILLSYASERLRDDYSIARSAICNCPAALEFASERLRNSKELVEQAVILDGEVLRFASTHIRALKCVVIKAVAGCGEAIRYASPDLQQDRDVFLAAVKTNPDLFRGSYSFHDDLEIVLAAVRANGNLLSLAPLFQDDKDVVSEALISDGTAIIYASARLQKDDELIFLASIETESPVLGHRSYQI